MRLAPWQDGHASGSTSTICGRSVAAGPSPTGGWARSAPAVGRGRSRAARPLRRASPGPAGRGGGWPTSHDTASCVATLRPSTATISLRLPKAKLEARRVLANEKDVPSQSLLEVYLAERIAQERAPARQRRRASVQRPACAPSSACPWSRKRTRLSRVTPLLAPGDPDVGWRTPRGSGAQRRHGDEPRCLQCATPR